MKVTYDLAIYDDGYLIMNESYDDFNEALERYAKEWKSAYYVDLFRHTLDDKGNILKAEKFKESWE